MSKNNQHGVFEADHYARFDRLPYPMRRMLWHAPVDYTVGWIEALRRRHGDDKTVKVMAATFAAERRANVLRHYGPTHPQVRRP